MSKAKFRVISTKSVLFCAVTAVMTAALPRLANAMPVSITQDSPWISTLQAFKPDLKNKDPLAPAIDALNRNDIATAKEHVATALELDPERAATWELQGTLDAIEGNLDNAIRAFKKAISLDSNQRSARTKLGIALLANSEIDEGREILEDVAREDPDNALANRYLGSIASAEKDYPRAIEHFRRAIKSSPAHFSPLHAELARIFENMKQYQDLDALLVPMLTTTPNDMRPRAFLAATWLEQDRTQEAQMQIKVIEQESPDFKGLTALKGILNRNLGRLETSIKLFRTLIESNPENAQAHYQLGLSLIADKKPKAAISALEDAYRLAPKNQRYLLDLSRQLILTKQFKSAIQRLEPKAGESGQPAVLAMLSEAYALDGQIDEALETSEALVKIAPNYIPGYITQIRLLQQSGEPRAARKVAQRLSSRFPDSEIAVKVHSQLLSAQRKTEAAEKLLLTWLDRHPENQSVRFDLASLYHAQKQTKRAQETYQTILDINPEHALALNNLASLLSDEGKDLKRATRLSRKAHQLQPESDNITDTYAWALYRNGNTEQAEKLLREIAGNTNAKPGFRCHLGTLLSNTGRQQEAATWLKSCQ